MLTEQLTNRQDLVQSLDSDAILDYLLQHGVLDDASCNSILQENNREQRNTALLHHLELIGSSAIGLFINALRQSGQLTLASSLDKHRIKPCYGKGYLEKQRHKGQITLNIQVDAIKAVFPKWEEGDSFEEKHGDTPEKERKLSCFDGLLRTPRRMHKSYADMTLIDDPENFMSPKSRKKLDYSYESEQDSDDDQRKGFCFCLCGPRKKKRRKPSNKTQQKYVNRRNDRSANDELLMKVLKQPHSSQTPITSTPSSQNIYTDYRLVQSEIKQETSAKTSEKTRTKSPLRDISNERRGDSKNRTDSPSKNKHEAGGLPKKQSKTNSHVKKSDNKENSSPSMRKSGCKGSVQNSNANISCDSLKLENLEPIEHCVMWKKRGPTFDGYEQKFYDILKPKPHLEIVKYFEQIRGTLVLHIYTENGLIIGTISMTIAQLKSLKKEIDNGQILCLLEKWLLSEQINKDIGVSEMKLKIVMDDNEFEMAYDELQ